MSLLLCSTPCGRVFLRLFFLALFFFTDPAPTEIYTLSLHDALPVYNPAVRSMRARFPFLPLPTFTFRGWLMGLVLAVGRSEEHTSELQSRPHLVCRLLLEKKKSYIHTLHAQSPAPI